MSKRGNFLVLGTFAVMAYGYLNSPEDPAPKPSQVAVQAFPQPGPASTSLGKTTASQPAAESIPLPKPRPYTRPAAPKAEILLTAAAIAALIVQASRQAYYATGHPCACPNDAMRNGRRCGARSAYSRPGGAAPLCYASDVTTAMIESYRARMSHTHAK